MSLDGQVLNEFPHDFIFTETKFSPSKKLSDISCIGSLLELLLKELDLVSLSIFLLRGSFLLPTCLDVWSSDDERLLRFPPPVPLFIDDVTETESLKQTFKQTNNQLVWPYIRRLMTRIIVSPTLLLSFYQSHL